MNAQELNALASQGESEILEFKKSTAQLPSVMRTACAFLNGKGGDILIGVSDDGRILGQHISDATRKDIAKEVKKIEPEAPVEVVYTDVSAAKVLIAVHVKPGTHAPYVYDGRAFQRNESTTERMTQHGYEQLLVQRGYLNYCWEEMVVPGMSMDDLDFAEISYAVRQGIAAGRIPKSVNPEAIENILKDWQLIKDGKINNAAAVLFAKDADAYYTQCAIRLGRFRGVNRKGSMIDNKRFSGNAFQLLDEATHFVSRHLPISSFFETGTFQREDKMALPVLAVREALINAICHRDYSNRAYTLSLAIFDDRMELWNKGVFPKAVEIGDLNKKHLSAPRNHRISKVFYDRNYFDGWGLGIGKIFDLCKEEGVPPPEYTEHSDGVEVTFRFKEPIGFTAEKKRGVPEPELTDRQREILSLLGEQGCNISKIFDGLKGSVGRRMIQLDLKHLEVIGLVGREGGSKTTIWRILQ